MTVDKRTHITLQFNSLMSCDIFRWEALPAGFDHETQKVSTFRHRGARFRIVGWTFKPQRVDSSRVRRRSLWEESGVQKKWSCTEPSHVRRTVRQLPESLTANWSTTCRQRYHTKWRSERRWVYYATLFIHLSLGPSVSHIRALRRNG